MPCSTWNRRRGWAWRRLGSTWNPSTLRSLTAWTSGCSRALWKGKCRMGSSRRAERSTSLLVAPRRARTNWTCRTGDADDTITTTTITIGDTTVAGGTARDVADTAGGVGDTTAVAGPGTTAVAIIAVAVSPTVATADTAGVVESSRSSLYASPHPNHGITGSNLHSALLRREECGWLIPWGRGKNWLDFLESIF